MKSKKLTYQRPVLVKEGKMSFPRQILEAGGKRLACKQCSNCHGCR